jgi:uncharacterized membrane protein
MPRLFSIKPGITLKGRKFKGLRGWAGKPSHPPLTDIPIACYILVAVFDLISYVKGETSVGHDFFVSATHVLVVGAITALGAAITGFWDWWKGLERDRSTGVIGKAKHTQAWRTANWHMTIMLTVTAIVVVDILCRLAKWDEGVTTMPILILSVIIASLVTLGAAYGGSLVYDYEFNVEQSYGGVWAESEVDIMPGQGTD